MRVVIWVLQIALAGMFIMAGFMKTFTPIEELAVKMPFAKDMVALTRFIGVAEILGGIGLILPSLLKFKPILTSWAGVGIGVIMIFALIFHISRAEYASLPMNIVLGGIAFYIAWARAKMYPIAQR